MFNKNRLTEAHLLNMVASALDDTFRPPKKIFKRTASLFPTYMHQIPLADSHEDECRRKELLSTLVHQGRATTGSYDFFRSRKKIFSDLPIVTAKSKNTILCPVPKI